ncbi:hypothetical protein YB2330_005483 [Saitoella coloradoensis]
MASISPAYQLLQLSTAATSSRSLYASPVLVAPQDASALPKPYHRELALAIDGEGINIYDVHTQQMNTSYPLPPSTRFVSEPVSLLTKATKARLTAVLTSSTTLLHISHADAAEPAKITTHTLSQPASAVHFLSGTTLVLTQVTGGVTCLNAESLEEQWQWQPEKSAGKCLTTFGPFAISKSYLHTTHAVNDLAILAIYSGKQTTAQTFSLSAERAPALLKEERLIPKIPVGKAKVIGNAKEGVIRTVVDKMVNTYKLAAPGQSHGHFVLESVEGAVPLSASHVLLTTKHQGKSVVGVYDTTHKAALAVSEAIDGHVKYLCTIPAVNKSQDAVVLFAQEDRVLAMAVSWPRESMLADVLGKPLTAALTVEQVQAVPGDESEYLVEGINAPNEEEEDVIEAYYTLKHLASVPDVETFDHCFSRLAGGRKKAEFAQKFINEVLRLIFVAEGEGLTMKFWPKATMEWILSHSALFASALPESGLVEAILAEWQKKDVNSGLRMLDIVLRVVSNVEDLPPRDLAAATCWCLREERTLLKNLEGGSLSHAQNVMDKILHKTVGGLDGFAPAMVVKELKKERREDVEALIGWCTAMAEQKGPGEEKWYGVATCALDALGAASVVLSGGEVQEHIPRLKNIVEDTVEELQSLVAAMGPLADLVRRGTLLAQAEESQRDLTAANAGEKWAQEASRRRNPQPKALGGRGDVVEAPTAGELALMGASRGKKMSKRQKGHAISMQVGRYTVERVEV